MSKRICWITATYFLDVDLPIVPKLMDTYSIDWKIVTSTKQIESDRKYINSQTNHQFELFVCDNRFYSGKLYNFYKKLIIDIKEHYYDWIYFDISDYFFLFPLVKKYLGNQNVTVATHNVSIPKGARLPLLAKWSMSYITHNFKHFQVFSKNQQKVLKRRTHNVDIFYCPLMLKDYGNKNEYEKTKNVRFLFFGNIIPYKRLDLLLKAVNVLKERGISNFKVNICGNCRKEVWEQKYAPLIKHKDIINCDIRRIPNELVSSYFNSNDYFVMPYQDIAQSGAMTVALNYNMPIIASNLDTFNEFITHKYNGFLFEPGDYIALADAMEWAIKNSDKDYSVLKVNLQQMVDENLSESKIVSRYLDYFNKCLHA